MPLVTVTRAWLAAPSEALPSAPSAWPSTSALEPLRPLTLTVLPATRPPRQRSHSMAAQRCVQICQSSPAHSQPVANSHHVPASCFLTPLGSRSGRACGPRTCGHPAPASRADPQLAPQNPVAQLPEVTTAPDSPVLGPARGSSRSSPTPAPELLAQLMRLSSFLP